MTLLDYYRAREARRLRWRTTLRIGVAVFACATVGAGVRTGLLMASDAPALKVALGVLAHRLVLLLGLHLLRLAGRVELIG